MHELAIAESIIDVLNQEVNPLREFDEGINHVKDRKLSKGVRGRITSIKLKIGEMSGVVPSALEFSFQVASKGTLAEGARLYIEHVPITAMCGDCSGTFQIRDYSFECSICGGGNFRIIAGRELLIEEVEVEDEG